jgi:hypothetical protein
VPPHRPVCSRTGPSGASSRFLVEYPLERYKLYAHIDQHKHTVGHPTYNARLLAMVLTNTTSDKFMTTIIHCIPADLRNDGSFLLWAVSHNIIITQGLLIKVRIALLRRLQ